MQIKITVAFNPFFKNIDFLKLDIEAHEKLVIESSDMKDWENFESMINIHDENNAKGDYDFFIHTNLNMFFQKINWGIVKNFSDMPINHYDGTLFVNIDSEMKFIN